MAVFCLAETKGFEPLRPFGRPHFECGSLRPLRYVSIIFICSFSKLLLNNSSPRGSLRPTSAMPRATASFTLATDNSQDCPLNASCPYQAPPIYHPLFPPNSKTNISSFFHNLHNKAFIMPIFDCKHRFVSKQHFETCNKHDQIEACKQPNFGDKFQQFRTQKSTCDNTNRCGNKHGKIHLV